MTREHYRTLAAIAAMQGILADPEDWPKVGGKNCRDSVTHYAVEHADSLLKRLEETRPKQSKNKAQRICHECGSLWDECGC